jgi:hypothetical protein
MSLLHWSLGGAGALFGDLLGSDSLSGDLLASRHAGDAAVLPSTRPTGRFLLSVLDWKEECKRVAAGSNI